MMPFEIYPALGVFFFALDFFRVVDALAGAFFAAIATVHLLGVQC